uniref:Uncharacterized protein n=1 Tax=Meloidogyne enterolobii TaxID=390850 RepID=A0A6V7UVB1_MELEN|nr:unnamed protein product [Meloidogyne enterolobii]
MGKIIFQRKLNSVLLRRQILKAKVLILTKKKNQIFHPKIELTPLPLFFFPFRGGKRNWMAAFISYRPKILFVSYSIMLLVNLHSIWLYCRENRKLTLSTF